MATSSARYAQCVVIVSIAGWRLLQAFLIAQTVAISQTEACASKRPCYGQVARIIVTRHVGDGKITSPKLAEAFIKGRQQDNTTNSTQSGLRMQWGWGFMPGNGTAIATDSVTFPVAFASGEKPTVIITANGYKLSDPTSPSDTSGSVGWPVNARGQSNTGFTAEYSQASGTLANTIRIAYTWIAIGKG